MLLKNLILIFLVLIPPTIAAAAEVSPQIYTTIKSFFGMTGNKLILHGELVNTATEFGRHCQLSIDLRPPGKGFIALKNEYTPQAMVGEGIFFAEGNMSYSFNQTPPKTITLQQTLSETFSTWITTELQASKGFQLLTINLKSSQSFLFFTDNQEKHCIIRLNKQ